MTENQWYNKDIDYVVEQLDTSREGLTSEEAEARFLEYGPNELIQTGGIHPLRMFLEQFTDPMVLILLAAIVISLFAAFYSGLGSEHEGESFIDAIVIAAIVIFNAIFGFIQEYRSEKALEALKQMAAPRARVKRDGLWTEIDSRELVPGDLIGLETGDLVAADGRAIYAVGLSADEAPLTGESVSVRKTDDTIDLKKPSVGDMRNLVFQGTTITSGKGNAVVTATGMGTQFGHIAEMVQASEKSMTPLQKDLNDLGKKLGILVIVVIILVFAAEVIYQVSDDILDELMVAIALAVSAIPEGLPAVVTITLAIGVQRMVRRNAIVRRLPSVETLGSTTIICSDKTGTITKNEMTARVVYTNGMMLAVSGVGYNKEGGFSRNDEEYNVLSDPHVLKLVRTGQICSNSLLQPDMSGSSDWMIVGDPTEGALLVLAEKAGLTHEETLSESKEIHEISFDSARKRMTSIVRESDGRFSAYAKGAPEVLLTLCSSIYEDDEIRPLTEEDRERILSISADLADDALRVLALAFRPLEREIPDWDPEKVEKDFIFLGLVGMIDPPREEVEEAINVCKKAGIRPIMITGDHRLTARAVARDVGLISEDGEVLNGTDIDDMSDEEFINAVSRCDVFARVAPDHKLRIVQALKQSNEVVAMTGDGVNDAPAIKSADIGISMGIRGSDVTKEASDVILTDDNFATIVSAVEKGREIYSNIRKYVRYTLAANFDEVFLIFTVIMLGLPLPITAIQILLLNLTTDGFPAVALGVDPPEDNMMDRPPRKPGAKMMDEAMTSFILISGFISYLGSLIVFMGLLTMYGGWIPGLTGPLVNWGIGSLPADISTVTGIGWDQVLMHARAAVYVRVIMFELMFVWNCRDEYMPLWRTRVKRTKALFAAVVVSAIIVLATVYLPPMWILFETVPLNPIDWLIILATSATSLLIPTHLIFGYWRKKKGIG
jgi:Ca2+-transporting ATPase